MSQATVTVTLGPGTGPWGSKVVVHDDDGSGTTHEVSLSRETFERLHRREESPEAFVTRCFEFLLAREPKESILSTFDIDVIETYFPDFEALIAQS